jgi:hypothetical protein
MRRQDMRGPSTSAAKRVPCTFDPRALRSVNSNTPMQLAIAIAWFSWMHMNEFLAGIFVADDLSAFLRIQMRRCNLLRFIRTA